MTYYDDKEEMVIEFYFCSLKNDFSKFDWDGLQDFLPELQNKLDEHGQGSFEGFDEIQDNIYGDESEAMPHSCCMLSDYILFTKQDAMAAVRRAMYDTARSAFSGLFDHIERFIDGINNLPESLQERITLFDNIIHAQHETGDIFDCLDTEDLKKAAREMFECETDF